MRKFLTSRRIAVIFLGDKCEGISTLQSWALPKGRVLHNSAKEFHHSRILQIELPPFLQVCNADFWLKERLILEGEEAGILQIY